MRTRFKELFVRMTQPTLEKKLSGEDELVIIGDLIPVPVDPDRLIERLTGYRRKLT
jgi:hypothetical protein